MKFLLVALMMSTLVACGPVKEIACNGVKSDFLCVMIDGSTEDRIDNIENEDVEQNRRIAELEKKQVEQLDMLFAVVAQTQAQLNNLQAQIDALYMSIGQLAAEVQNLPYSVVSIVDPCPNVGSNNPKEMLIKVDSRVFAYFEQGNSRFLAELKVNTTYQTTDSRACQFTINNL